MRKIKRYRVLIMLVVLVAILSACANKEDNGTYYDSAGSTNQMDDKATTSSTKPMEPSADYDMAEGKKEANGADDFGVSKSGAYTFTSKVVSPMEKIIRRVNMELETQEFDDLIQSIDAKIAGLGGYVESSNISGRRYRYSNELRRGNIIARIPKDQMDEFVDEIYENANVVNKTESTENVTLEYIDTESRKKSLEIEQERLFVLLEKTGTLEEIITLESRLSSIRYELQQYETQLRTYDNLVEYSTISLSVYEVERMTPAVEEKVTVFSRIKNGFSDTIYDISEGLQNFFVGLVINLPYLLIWAVIIAAVIIIIRRYYKKHFKKSNPEPSLYQKIEEKDVEEKR